MSAAAVLGLSVIALTDHDTTAGCDEAVSVSLSSRGRYHFGRKDTPVHAAIQMIADAGGVTVLAHAFAPHRGPTITAEVIKELAGAGLTGLEVDHPDHSPAVRVELS